ncbi:hypothetical protein A3H89_03065 [Candidatus Amesbacteria bacterium RIFCSPLOWO2_02_FULL_48_11]|uniref:Uncharacterized protein n=4 Tax=Candidatus Amesiibacteriota TaxID=1752730 RepID=A0A1F4Z7S7_9BACT|nr:MAG: hypothetical protein UX78_C0005G0038 [Candidatus Amesbacteria bacterium GW2011_GWA2_47_11]KKU92939.1 MAG: hypothetical protein UY22_C0024G0005 [Candidatus Amesbacteria bacterium GW2011_GWC1_48_10]OGC90889.1 MAG: hypothetical protein A2V48_01920 [Candidatus Amesbacteria bacterium RBG_19FT_COMBO_48_16]OGC96791.1 MAG: hypothetical protein A3C34_01730 [Candidatus Amesbacteria bacterium RIFCSPHIGHO2_02_FULL_48_21]OGC99340.1 MAG: hypothetical protein A2W16_02315 [Candidatus Amesbacteria bacte
MNAIEAEKNERKRMAADFGPKERKVRSHMAYRSNSGGVTVNIDKGIEILKRLYRLGLEERDILLPVAANEMGALANMLVTGLRCVIPTCLDYSYRQKGGKKTYTFEEIGDGLSGNSKTLISKAPILLGAVSEAGGTVAGFEMLVSDVEAKDEIYQLMSGLNERQIRLRAEGTRRKIERDVQERGLGLMTVGLMESFVEIEDEEFGRTQMTQVGGTTKTSIGASRSTLYQTMFERSKKRGLIEKDGSRYRRFHNFMIDRVEADLRRYIALGAACRKRGVAVVDATAPEVAKYYNVAADKYPVTPYIRIVDNYE